MVGILSVSKVGRLGLRALIYFTFTMVIAVTFGLFISTMVKGGLPLINTDVDSAAETMEVVDITLMDQIVNMFPHNIVELTADQC